MPMFIPSKNAAVDRVNRYVSEKLIYYQSKRNHDFGGIDANYVSYLSPYLRHRVITEEYVIKQALSLYPFNKIEKLELLTWVFFKLYIWMLNLKPIRFTICPTNHSWINTRLFIENTSLN